MFSLVGSPPSSGSTLFADLLDSTHFTACGEEIDIFATRKFYDFSSFKKNIFKRSLSSIYLYTVGVNKRVLPRYGLDLSTLKELFQQAKSPAAFSDLFAKYYFALRGKSQKGTLFEKTPQNINCLDNILEAFPEAVFIFVVRNPIFVYYSMRRRGFSPYISSATWLAECSKFYQYRTHPRVLYVRYEDLVSDPYAVVSNLLREVFRIPIDENDLQKNFRDNQYRKLFSIRLPAWRIREVGEVSNANRLPIPEQILSEFIRVLGKRLRPAFCKLNNIANPGCNELMSFFGYLDDVMETTKRIFPDPQPLKPSLSDIRRLLARWALGVRLREASFLQLPAFLKPL